MVRRPGLPLLARLNELISSFWLWPMWELGTRTVVPVYKDSARDLYEDSHEKWLVFGGFVQYAAPLRPPSGGDSALRRSFTRINRYGGTRTAHESNTHTMT